METRRVRILVSGTVQGVFFRQSTRESARRLGLAGWVRNLDDGRVEVEAQGPAEAVDELVAACRRGPSDADVEEFQVADVDPVEGASGFDARP